ncbi:MAG: response regulator [Treponema sp.]|nr:response regulator [Treponema sp.]
MGNENSIYFDLPILLRFGGLDIVKTVRNNLSMRVEDYFNLLIKFENDAPKTAEVLNKIAIQKADENDFENLEKPKKLLMNMGCNKITSAIDEIVKMHTDGRIDFAADCAKNTLEDFNRLKTRITAAKKTGKTETISGAADGVDSPDNDGRTQFLKDVLIELDKQESTRKLRILAVDDSPVILTTVSSVLSDYKVYGMQKPAMLKGFLDQITPDLFLLDYEMPEINGFELIPIVRSFDEHKETPIIFLTSMGTLEHVSAAHALGACDFMVKPFQGDNLREKVAKHIVRKKLIF